MLELFIDLLMKKVQYVVHKHFCNTLRVLVETTSALTRSLTTVLINMLLSLSLAVIKLRIQLRTVNMQSNSKLSQFLNQKKRWRLKTILARIDEVNVSFNRVVFWLSAIFIFKQNHIKRPMPNLLFLFFCLYGFLPTSQPSEDEGLARRQHNRAVRKYRAGGKNLKLSRDMFVRLHYIK